MKIRNILKTAKILIILIVIAVCGQTGIIEQEVKTSNNNLNKTLDLTAMALKIDEINLIFLFLGLKLSLSAL